MAYVTEAYALQAVKRLLSCTDDNCYWTDEELTNYIKEGVIDITSKFGVLEDIDTSLTAPRTIEATRLNGSSNLKIHPKMAGHFDYVTPGDGYSANLTNYSSVAHDGRYFYLSTRAFDHNTASRPFGFPDFITRSIATELDAPAAITKVKLWNAIPSNPCFKDWQLIGKNGDYDPDWNNWTVCYNHDTDVGDEWILAGQQREYIFENTNLFKLYALRVFNLSDADPSPGICYLGEAELYIKADRPNYFLFGNSLQTIPQNYETITSYYTKSSATITDLPDNSLRLLAILYAVMRVRQSEGWDDDAGMLYKIYSQDLLRIYYLTYNNEVDIMPGFKIPD